MYLGIGAQPGYVQHIRSEQTNAEESTLNKVDIDTERSTEYMEHSDEDVQANTKHEIRIEPEHTQNKSKQEIDNEDNIGSDIEYKYVKNMDSEKIHQHYEIKSGEETNNHKSTNYDLNAKPKKYNQEYNNDDDHDESHTENEHENKLESKQIQEDYGSK